MINLAHGTHLHVAPSIHWLTEGSYSLCNLTTKGDPWLSFVLKLWTVRALLVGVRRTAETYIVDGSLCLNWT
jgi:hypothetical protein